jgi:hypothetical protein
MFPALCGLIAPIVFGTLVTIGGVVYENYSHASQAISELGGVESQFAVLQNANFFITGALITIFAFGLYRSMGSIGGLRTGAVLIGVFGVVTALAQPVLPCDPGCEFQTLTGTLHNLTGMSGFLAIIAGVLLIARRSRTDPYWGGYSRYSLFMGIATFIALVAWIGVTKAAGVESLNGVLQRVFVGIVLVWIGVTAIRMLRFTGSVESIKTPVTV